MQRKVPEIPYTCLADARANENSPELHKSYCLIQKQPNCQEFNCLQKWSCNSLCIGIGI